MSSAEAKEYFEVGEVVHLGDFRLRVTFNNGTTRDLDLTTLITAAPPVFAPLSDVDTFSKVRVNPVGGIVWECGADLGAEFLRDFDPAKPLG